MGTRKNARKPKRKSRRKPTEEHRFVTLQIDDYAARVDASINYEVRDKRMRHDDTRVYAFSTDLELTGTCTYPEEQAGAAFHITVYGDSNMEADFAATLADCQERDELGARKYDKVRGEYQPVYAIRKGIGHLEKQRGTSNWSGAIWVSPETAGHMLTLLTNVRPLYVQIHERKIKRVHWIAGLTLQTSDPEAE